MIREDVTLPHVAEWELFHNGFSLCSKKLRVCMAELGLAYESHHIDLIETGRYENVGREYLAINPAGLVPVLVHHGHPIYESHDEIAYAAAHAGERGRELLPGEDEPEARAVVEHWTDCASLKGRNPIDGTDARAGHCVPPLTLPIFATMVQGIPYREIARGLLTHPNKERPLLFATLKLLGVNRLPVLRPAVKLLRRARRDMGRHLDALGERLDAHGGPWIVGDRFTLADVSWVVILDRLHEADWADYYWGDDRRPAISAYWQRLRSRRSYDEAIEAARGERVRAGMAAVARAKADDPRLREALEGA